jgi:DNA-binding CsgD family transcriptional regulator
MEFVGRDDELISIQSLADSGSSRGVVLGGVPGVGKTALAREFCRRVEQVGGSTSWVVAAPSLEGVPFGAFTPLLGTLREPGHRSVERVEVVANAYEAARDALEETTVLAVDDLHLLDPGSAALLALLVAGNVCFVVMTARTGNPIPPEIDGYWRSGDIHSIEVGPLARETIDAVCVTALGGVVDRRLRERLCDAAGGNLLYLRELMCAGIETGRLRNRDGVWTWDGPLAVGPHLAEVVGSRLSCAGEEVLHLIRLVMLGEPLPLNALRSLCSSATIETAEAMGLVAIVHEGRRTYARLAHSLYGEVMRQLDGTEVARRASSELVDCLATIGLRRDGDIVRLSLLELQAGDVRDVERMTAAAGRARGLGDIDLATKFATSAAETAPNASSKIELVECLVWQGNHDVALAVADTLDPATFCSADRVRLAVNVATIQFFGRDALDEAVSVLDAAERAPTDAAGRLRLRAHRAELCMFSGEIVEAHDTAMKVLSAPNASTVARAAAHGAAVPSLALAGRIEEAVVAADEGLAFLLAQTDPPMYEGAGIMVGRFLAALLGGGLVETSSLVEGLYLEVAGRPADPLFGVWGLMLGRMKIATGELDAAVELLTEAAASFRHDDPSRLLSWALGALAQAHAMRGDADAARAAVNEMSAAGALAARSFGLDREVGRAWASAVAGDLEQSEHVLRSTARDAFRSAAYGSGVFAVFEGFRLGVRSRAALDLCPRTMPVDGQLLPLAVEISTTSLEPGELLERAGRLHALASTAWAVDTASIALRRAVEDGDQALALRAEGFLEGLNPAGRGMSTPALLEARNAQSGITLTPRERQVLSLVRAGRSNSEIAATLVVSKRTVESHLGRLFRKLGVTSRQDLLDS